MTCRLRNKAKNKVNSHASVSDDKTKELQDRSQKIANWYCEGVSQFEIASRLQVSPLRLASI
jgi:DNA-binding CsgD family transcriptional regulator